MPIALTNALKTTVIITTIALIFTFIINCFFAYPQTDDFCYSSISRSMGFFETQYHVYVTWSGRFTSTALLSINPLVYGALAGYKLLFAIFIIVQFISIYILTDVVTKKTILWSEKLVFTLILFFTYLDQMEDVRSGLYWMAGVITYQAAGTIYILYIAQLLSIKEKLNYGSLIDKLIPTLLVLILMGTNEIIMALVLVITALFILDSYLMKKRVNAFMIILGAMAFIGSCIVIIAPGTFARLSEYPQQKNFLKILWYSIEKFFASAAIWITSPLTLILTVTVLLAVINKPKLKLLFSSYKIKYSTFLLFSLTTLCFFIPYWSTGMPPVNRVINMIYLFFMLGWLMNIAIFCSHYSENIIQLTKKIPVKVGCPIAVVYLIILFSLSTSNFILVYKDLLSGSSFQYNVQMKQRESQILNSDSDKILLENITITPRSLYFFFISNDPKYWINGCYASYFGKKNVSLIIEQNCKPSN